MAFWNKRATPGGAHAAAVRDPQPALAEERSGGIDMIKTSDAALAQFFGLGAGMTDEVVTIETALQVPSVWAAVGFLSRTLASLPIKVFEKTDAGRVHLAGDPVEGLLNRAANDETSAFAWRQGFWQDVFTGGRAISFIERNGRGDPINLWPLDVARVTVERKAGRTLYKYRDGSTPRTYAASEVIDLAFMPGSDRLGGRSPIYSNATTIGLALAVTRYGAQFFRNGGVPPFAITGPIRTAGGVQRAADDLTAAVQKMAEERRNAISLPEGHDIKNLGVEPEKMQMIETQRFMVEQIARIYGMPPVFLQDLTHGTFSNTEQQDLHLIKHVISQWVKAFESEANLKLYGRARSDVYAEASLDALLRGDLKTRAEARAAQINTGQLLINEAREQDNRPAVPGGDVPLVQGAMVPAAMAGQHLAAGQPPAADKGAKE